MGEPALEFPVEEEDYEDLDDTWYDDQIWRPPEEVIPQEEPILLARTIKNLPVLPRVKPSQYAQFAFRFPAADEEGLGTDGSGYDRFSFEGRRHMQRLYDTPAKRILLFCGRQVEKCLTTCFPHQVVLLPNGMGVPAFDVPIGQELISYDEQTGRVCTKRVVAKKEVGSKPCIRIVTRQGHELRVATTHPILTPAGWVAAEDLEVGRRVGAIRRGGRFTADVRPDPRWVRLCPYFIADGGLGTSGYLAFTKKVGVVKNDFMAQLTGPFSANCRTYDTSGKRSQQHRLSNCDGIKDKLKQVGLWGCYSKDKFIPSEVFDYSRKNTALFLNRLWACDGSVKKETATKYSIEYSSISYRLVRQVQHLLWKFGIPTSYRRYQPKIYEGTNKYSHIIRVETRAGIRRFLTEIGVLGKSEGVPLPDESIPERNNRDTIPAELVRRYVEAALPVGKSLRKAGIERFPRNGVTQDRVRTLIESLLLVGAKKKDVALLDALLDSDLYWDEVELIEELGKEPCFDIEVEDTHNFLLSGVFTHNSTLLGNRALCYMSLVKDFRVLYVSASATQAKKFSADRIREPIETSPVLRRFTTTMLSSNILEKQFVNRSQITMRYAYLNADRCAVGGTRVHFTDGGVATLQDIYENPEHYVGEYVWSVNPDEHIIQPTRLLEVVPQGLRKVRTVRLAGGTELTCTHNQPLLTWDGWRMVQDLSEGDFVAAPRNAPHGQGNDISLEEYRLVGYLLGDGKVTQFKDVALYSSNREVLDDFQRCALALGAVVGRELDDNPEKWVNACVKKRQMYGGRNGYKQRLQELGLIGSRHDTKRVPSEFFSGDAHQVSDFLRAIYATDGWACVSGDQYEVGYCSNSKGLLQDLKVLLSRFGILAFVSKQKNPSTAAALGAFTLSVRNAPSVRLFCENIGIIGKEEAVDTVRKAAWAVARYKDDHDRVPLSYASLRDYLKLRYGLSTHAAWTRYRIQLRPGNNKDSIGRRVLHTLAEKLEDPYLESLAACAVGWVRIESMEDAGEQETFDLTVGEHENYLVDGLFVHNTRGIPADLLCIDEFQDILGDNVPVIEQCLSHGRDRWKMYLYAGTPKSLDNSLEKYWSSYSTQNEWVVPHDCKKGEGGRYWNEGLNERNIGKRGLICANCGTLINPMCDDAQWATTGDPNADFEGYRIPQLMVPWVDWKHDIVLNYDRYPRDKFYNEVLGMSYDSGLRPLTRAQIRDNCNPELSMNNIESYRNLGYGQSIYAGIDWGCHDEDTRILTEEGFKYFADLTDDDKVAQWDPDTRKMTFVKPKVRTVRDWEQPLLHFKTKGGMDLMVTHTHRMRVGRMQGQSWVTEPAGDTALRGGPVHFIGWVNWDGEEVETFELPGLPVSPGYQGCEPKVFDMDEWVEFLGYVLTEGGVCLKKNSKGKLVPYCLKMSQRQTVNPKNYERIRRCMESLDIPFTEFPNPKTGDANWAIYGKQLWDWFSRNMGMTGDTKRIPRQFLKLSRYQLQILFDALVLGDGYTDPRENCTGGAYYSTSKGLCEDFQEVCIKLGLRCSVSLHKPAEGNRKARYRALWSAGRDYHLNTPSRKVKKVPYKGKVYCCAVPTGYVVTERNGKIAYHGNTGENSYTVIVLATYIDMRFRVFFAHRFTGEETDPDVQLARIKELIQFFNVKLIGCDYGGGYDRNHHLVRAYGPKRVWTFQHLGRALRKVQYDPKMGRFKVARSEVMGDFFNAIKRGKAEFPKWAEWKEPFAQDMLNIFSEFNENLRQLQYKHSQDNPDDTFHSLMYAWLVSMIEKPRPDIIVPNREVDGQPVSAYRGPIDQ